MPCRTFFGLIYREVGCKDVNFTSYQASPMIYFLSHKKAAKFSVWHILLEGETLHKAETTPASTYILNSVLFTEYFKEPRLFFCKCTEITDRKPFVFTFWRTGSWLIRVVRIFFFFFKSKSSKRKSSEWQWNRHPCQVIWSNNKSTVIHLCFKP